ncbi:hypothetical protein ACH5RR_009232 [Cinchona calisaya]|uniref:DUF659 domain-containing protein n=1 Tax=Cinchona calisaya TaxID=153742 RepID=A0ABD3ADK7_9GENT
MFDATCSRGAGNKAPNFYDLRAENVVHIVTDNAANYAAVGRLLEKEFHTLYWSPCATYCLNLMLQDIGKLEEDALRAMVTSKEWILSGYFGESKGKKFVDLVLDSMFWKECATIVQVIELHVRVLRLVDNDERSSTGYLYTELEFYALYLTLSRNARGRNYDPIEFEEFGANDTWILEDEPPNLTEVEMETFRKELAACTVQGGQENEDENNDEDNVGGANETFNVDDIQDHGGTEFGTSWEPWR